MKTKPILFSTEMVQAILDGRKTQTRRIVKPQPNVEFYCTSFEYPHAQIRCNEEEAQVTILRSPKTNRACFINKAPLLYNGKGANYKVGDILWVRETWDYYETSEECIDENTIEYRIAFAYKALNTLPKSNDIQWVKVSEDKYWKAQEKIDYEENHNSSGWKPSIHMPREAARIFLEVTDVRVERLQSISNSDALSEGIKVIEEDEDYFDYENNGEAGSYGTARGSFFSLWRKIYGDKCFDNNPFVWVYEFKQVEKPFNFF